MKQHLHFYFILALLPTHTPIASHYLQEPPYLITAVFLLTDTVYNQIPTADHWCRFCQHFSRRSVYTAPVCGGWLPKDIFFHNHCLYLYIYSPLPPLYVCNCVFILRSYTISLDFSKDKLICFLAHLLDRWRNDMDLCFCDIRKDGF